MAEGKLLDINPLIRRPCSGDCFLLMSLEGRYWRWNLGIFISHLHVFRCVRNLTYWGIIRWPWFQWCRIGIRSSDVQESLEKTVRGCGIALSSPRLVIPAGLYTLWAFSTRLTGTSTDSFHLEVGSYWYNKSLRTSLQHLVCVNIRKVLAWEFLLPLRLFIVSNTV